MAFHDALDLVRKVLPQRQDAEVAHYTSMGTLQKLIKDGGWRSVWCTSVRFMNDREEYAIGARAIQSAADGLTSGGRNLRPELVTALTPLDPSVPGSGVHVYATSLSRNPDELGQWRGYGDDGHGASVVTTTAGLKGMCRRDEIVGDVVYGVVEHETFAKRLLEEIDASALNGDDALIALQVGAVFLKDKGVEAEQEFRFVRVMDPDAPDVRIRESRRRLVPYVDPLEDGKRELALERIILGPGWQLRSLDPKIQEGHHVTLGVKRLLELQGPKGVIVPVKASAIPYDPS